MARDAQTEARADAAARIINDEMYQEAFAHVRAKMTEALLATPYAAEDTRERLYLMLRVLPELEMFFQDAINKGTKAKINLKVVKNE